VAKRTKREVADRIAKLDVIEVQLVDIPRSETDFRKRAVLSEFVRQVEAFIKDNRDVVLVGAKVR
jgi:hypothetical protein